MCIACFIIFRNNFSYRLQTSGTRMEITMTEEQTKMTWLDTPDPQKFINNAAKFNDLMMMYRCAIVRCRPSLKYWMTNFLLNIREILFLLLRQESRSQKVFTVSFKSWDMISRQENIQEYLNDVAGVR